MEFFNKLGKRMYRTAGSFFTLEKMTESDIDAMDAVPPNGAVMYTESGLKVMDEGVMKEGVGIELQSYTLPTISGWTRSLKMLRVGAMRTAYVNVRRTGGNTTTGLSISLDDKDRPFENFALGKFGTNSALNAIYASVMIREQQNDIVITKQATSGLIGGLLGGNPNAFNTDDEWNFEITYKAK